MKKNVLKILAIIIIAILILFFINLFRNYSIIKEICNSNDEFNKSIKNYYYEEKIEYTEGDIKQVKTENYVYDGIYLSKNYVDGILNTVSWLDTNTNESLSVDKTTGETKEDIDTSLKDKYRKIYLNANTQNGEIIKTVLSKNLFNIINIEEGCYIIETGEIKAYVDKETKLVKKIIAGNSTITLEMKEDTVTSNDVKKENI